MRRTAADRYFSKTTVCRPGGSCAIVIGGFRLL